MTSSSPRDVRTTMAGASSTCCGAEGERAGGISLLPPATPPPSDMTKFWAFELLVALQNAEIVALKTELARLRLAALESAGSA